MIGLLLLVGGLATGALTLVAGLQTQYSVSQFLPAGHPLIKADHETRRKFFLDESQPILITLDLDAGKRSDWLQAERLARLAKVTGEFKAIEGIKNALSLGTVTAASQSSDQLSVGTLLDLPSDGERRARVAHDRFLNPLLVSENARRTLMVLGVQESLSTQSLRDMAARLRTRLSEVFPEARVSIGGVPVIQSQLTGLVKKELVRFMGFALAACCLTLLLVFSSAWSVVIPFAAILVSNIFVLGVMSILGYSMTVLAVTIPILVSVSVLSLCIHTMLRFVEDAHANLRQERRGLSMKAALVVSTIRSLFMPNLLTALTTCFGFVTLAVTDVPVIREFGVAVSASMLIAWLCSTLVLAPLLALLPIPVVRPWVLKEATWSARIFPYARYIVPAAFVGCIAMAAIGQNLQWSARLFDDLPAREEARRTTEEIDKNLGGMIPFEILVEREKSTDPWNDPKAMRSLDELLHRLRGMTEVGSAVGLPDLLRLALGDPSAELPTARQAIAEAWFLISMSENNPLRQFVTADGHAMRLGLRLRDIESNRMEATMKRIEDDVRSVFPDAKITTGGMATTVHRLNDGVSRSMLEGYWHALAVITVILAFVFRSWRWTLTAVLPNLVPAAILVGVLALVKTPMKPGVALVFSIALGIAFNNTVYLLQRLRTLMEETGRGPREEIERALRLEGNPCMMASLCLLSGFGIFLVSDFSINQTFGAYMLISLFFGLVGDLVFLPALLKIAPWILVSTPKPRRANLIIPLHPSPEEKMAVVLNPATEASPASAIGPRAAAGFIAFFIAFAPVSRAMAGAPTDANKILKTVEKGLYSKDERVLIKMKVVESNGASKDRELEIKRKSGSKQQVLVRLKSPSDVSGVALLSVWQGGSEDQWLYMPSQKKARRIVSGNKSQKFLDTEFNLEDFSANTYSHFENKIVKEERAPSAAVAVIESKAKGTTESSYSKILTWVDLATYQVQKSEYFDKDGQHIKTMVFRDYKKFGAAWRAQTIEVRNMQTHRSTVLQVAGLKLNSGLNDREFTQTALESGD